MKEKLISNIYNLIYNNIYCSNHDSERWRGIAINGYQKRIIGFKAEIEFQELMQQKEAILFDGGHLLSTVNKNRCYDSALYFTVTKDEPDKYIDLYNFLSKIGFEKMYLLNYSYSSNIDLWSKTDILNIGVEILHPQFSVFRFDNGSFLEDTMVNFSDNYQSNNRNYRGAYDKHKSLKEFTYHILSKYNVDSLIQILADRYIFDGVIGFKKTKGIPSDIDCILKNSKGFFLFEIKEKDKSKTPPQGFGMDVVRRDDIIYLMNKLSSNNFFYIVKEIDNQKNRRFIDWKYINMRDFYEETTDSRIIMGGYGMSTMATGNATVVAPYEKFTIYK